MLKHMKWFWVQFAIRVVLLFQWSYGKGLLYTEIGQYVPMLCQHLFLFLFSDSWRPWVYQTEIYPSNKGIFILKT